MMRESHPYRKVSEREKKKKCFLQPVFNFFEEHSSLFHCDTQLGVVGVLFLYRSWSPVLQFLTACRSSICSLFSFVSFFSPRRSYSSAIPRIFPSPGAAASSSSSSFSSPISQLTHTTPAETARSSCPRARERDGRRRR